MVTLNDLALFHRNWNISGCVADVGGWLGGGRLRLDPGRTGVVC